MADDEEFELRIQTKSGEHICDLTLDAEQHGALLSLGLNQLFTELLTEAPEGRSRMYILRREDEYYFYPMKARSPEGALKLTTPPDGTYSVYELHHVGDYDYNTTTSVTATPRG